MTPWLLLAVALLVGGAAAGAWVAAAAELRRVRQRLADADKANLALLAAAARWRRRADYLEQIAVHHALRAQHAEVELDFAMLHTVFGRTLARIRLLPETQKEEP